MCCSCALLSKSFKDIECENSRIEKNIFRVKCWGDGDADPLEVQSAFQDYAMNVCRKNGYSYFSFDGGEPELSISYDSIINCTEKQ